MLKKGHFFLIAAILALLLTGCAGVQGDVTASLDKEFTLAIGQTASIRSEGIQIRFKDVVGDSRCPKGVTCVWQGEVSCALQMTVGGVAEDIVWKQPGLTDEHSRINYKGYLFAFEVEPYPEAGKDISKNEYRMKMTVSKG